MRSIFGFFLVLLSLSLAQAAPLTLDQKMADFNVLVGHIEAGYGPLHYKQAKGIANIGQLKEKYTQLIKETETDRDFYYMLIRFVAEFKDGHFAAQLPTSAISMIPVFADLIEGKVLIAQVLQALMPMEFPFDRGDEIVEVNGRPVMETVNELQKYMGTGYDLTAKRMATWMLFYRPARRIPTAEGVASIKIKKASTGVESVVQLPWMQAGVALDEDPDFHDIRPQFTNRKPTFFNYDDFSIAPVADLIGKERAEMSYICSDSTRIAIPADATIIMMEPIVAYYHPTPKGNVGYLRLPHYAPQNAAGEPDFEARFKQYEYAVRILEANTVGLIIDQDHNCGGSVAYLEQMVSLFADKPFEPIQFSLRANKAEFLGLSAFVAQAPKFTLFGDHLNRVLNILKTSWQKGDYLTEKVGFTSSVPFHPNPIRYTKPIIVTIDEVAGSGGDAFPAILQGIGRAKLLGTRTSGLGGHVGQLPPLPFSQMRVNMTKSLFYRPDGVPVENNGAEPDIPYTHTYNDFVNQYVDYQAFYLKKLMEMIP